MALIIMYALMIFDLLMTVVHHEEAGELNPLFTKILAGQPVHFIYIKLAFNSLAAFGILLITKLRPVLGTIFTILGIIIYLIVAYLHIEVWRVNNGLTPLLPFLTAKIDSLYY